MAQPTSRLFKKGSEHVVVVENGNTKTALVAYVQLGKLSELGKDGTNPHVMFWTEV